MVKPKAQVKATEKTEADARKSSRPTKVAGIENLDPLEKIEAETLENRITMVAKSGNKSPAGMTDTASAVMAAKDPNLTASKIARVKTVKEGKPVQPKEGEKVISRPTRPGGKAHTPQEPDRAGEGARLSDVCRNQ